MNTYLVIVKLGIMCMVDSGFTVEDEISKVTAVVNFKGSLDVMVSPLMLEALQRYIINVK